MMVESKNRSVPKLSEGTIHVETRNSRVRVASKTKDDQLGTNKAAMLPPSRNDSREAKEKVETVLRDASKEIATVLLMMPPIASTERVSSASSVLTRDSFDVSFSTIDSDEETIDEWLDELEEELVGLCLLPKEKASTTVRKK